MLLMVTNRRTKNGEYGDEEQSNRRYDYLYDYNGASRGQDAFLRKGKRGFNTALLAELKRLKEEENVNTPKVGIFVHGYNTSYQESIDALVDLEKCLAKAQGYVPVLVGFSWPSSGKTANYLSDREEVRDTVPAFTRFLMDLNELAHDNEQDCFSTTFCVAHSMGNYLLRKGMEYMSDALGSPQGRKLFDETIMMAPDLASKDIELDGKGRYIANFSRRIHVYYSEFDRALKASSAKRFGGNRLGRHGADDYFNLPSNVVIIDAKKFAESDALKQANVRNRLNEVVSVHSSHRYHPEILGDVVDVLSSVDRHHITGRKPRTEDGLTLSNHFELTGRS